MTTDLSREEIQAFKDMARSFAKREIGPMLEHEAADGDLARMPAILEEAHATGLAASPDPDAPGHYTGIWGGLALDQGPAVSLMLLEELARGCGGVAMAAHAHGLACLLLGRAGYAWQGPSAWMAAALSEGGFPPGAQVLQDPARMAPARVETVAEARDGGYVLSGQKHFVFHPPGVERFIVFARLDDKWAAFLVGAKEKGVTLLPAGTRMGLRACPVSDLSMEDLALPAHARLVFPEPISDAVMDWLGLWHLGLVAIAAGVARGALAEARAYAEERYQGGTEIIHHPGMAALLAEADAGILAVQGMAAALAQADASGAGFLLAAAKARLAALPLAARSVTDSLQIFGGYGYMEDYPLEKRFRDINSLKSAGGSARDLRALIADLGMEV